MTDPFAALRLLFVERCRQDLQQLRPSPGEAESDRRGVIVHGLAGAAGSFGFPDLSAAARLVDEQIRDGHEVREADMDRLLALLTEVSAPTGARQVRLSQALSLGESASCETSTESEAGEEERS